MSDPALYAIQGAAERGESDGSDASSKVNEVFNSEGSGPATPPMIPSGGSIFDAPAGGAALSSTAAAAISNETAADIAATLARIELGQIALQKQFQALQDHSNLVGYLVEQVLARPQRPTPWVTGKLQAMKRFTERRARAGWSAAARRLRPLLQPAATAQSIRQAFELASVTSQRASWSRSQQRWRQRLNWRVFAESAASNVGKVLLERRQQLYSINQRRPTVTGARPRIMHIIPNVFVGGSTQLIVDLFDHLGHKYEMQVATSAFPRGGVHRGMIIHDMREPTSAEAFVDLFGKFSPDILHVHYWGETDRPWYEKAFAAARLSGHRVIENINTPVTPFFDERVARYIYVSNYVRGRFGAGSEDEVVIHPGIDLARFSPPQTEDPHRLVSIGMVYRLEPDKLNAESIEPLIRAVQMRPKTRAFVVGGGSFFQHYRRRVEEAGVRDNFVFTGYVPYEKLPEYYSQFSVFVAPVWQESFGQAAVFAMNMGAAVAGNKVGALPEILGGEDRLGSSVEDTASRLVSLLDDPARLMEIGAQNRLRAQQMFGIETMCRRYGEVYDEVLGRLDPMPNFPAAQIFAAP